MDSSKAAREKGTVTAGRMAALIVGAAVCFRGAIDPDLWGHLRFGLDILHGEGFPSVDPYSFTQDVPWINHEWLSEVSLAIAYSIGGLFGLMALKAILVGGGMVVMWRLTRGTSPEFRYWLLAIAFINLVPIGVAFRPQLFTILFVPLLCLILEREKYAWLPLLFAVWVNAHGGWLVGGGVLAFWTLGRVLDARSLEAAVRPAGFGLLSLLATLVNPYGWNMWAFLGATVRLSRPDITEWSPYWESFRPEFIALFPLTFAVFSITTVTRWRAIHWSRLLPALWLAYSAMMVVRLGAFFGELTLFLAAQAWGAGVTSAASTIERSRFNPRRMIDAVAAIAVAFPTMTTDTNCLVLKDDWAPDVVAAAALSAPEVHGNLAVAFNWGEYAIWHWGRKLRVSVDGRRETVYSDRTIREQMALPNGFPEGLAFLDRARPEYVWQPRIGARTPEWLTANGYRLDVQTPKSYVAVRADLPVLAPAQALSSCFP